MRPIEIGCLTFVVCFVFGLFDRLQFLSMALDDLPVTEVDKAIYRDLVVRSTLVVFAISLAASLAAWISRIRQTRA